MIAATPAQREPAAGLKNPHLWCRVLATLAMLLALLAVAGHLLGLPRLITMFPGMPAMAIPTAIALLILAGSVMAQGAGREGQARTGALAAVLVAGFAQASSFFLGQDVLTGWFEQWLPGAALAMPGRVSVATAIAVCCLAVSISARRRSARLADLAAAACATIAGTALLGHAYGVRALYALPNFSGIAVNTALGLVLLAGASVLSVPGTGWARVILQGGSIGTSTRRQLGFLLVPPLAGWIFVRASASGNIGPAAAMALLLMATIIPFAFLILRDGRTLSALEQARREKSELDARHALDLEQRLDRQAAEIETQSTQRIEREAVMHSAQRMEALGQLTGGIAHDFNNLLMSISGNLQILLGRELDDRDRELAQRALDATNKGTKVTGQLLAFSRTQRLALRSFAIEPVLTASIDMISTALGRHIRVVPKLRAGSAWVFADPDQLELALLNLAVNARDAMPGGGTLTIESSLRQHQAREATGPASYIAISVRDDGAGMTPDVLARAAEPFFTTKERGKGTGLGLAQAYGFAAQCKGELKIESEPGKGTCIEMLLPLGEVREEPAATPPPPQAPAAGGEPQARAVLLVDDDDLVRNVMLESLQLLGYNVCEASDGPSAIGRLDSFKPDIALIDFMMPGMNGAEVARRVQMLHPGLPVIFVTGFAESLALDGIANAGVLRKPFEIDALGVAIEASLA